MARLRICLMLAVVCAVIGVPVKVDAQNAPQTRWDGYKNLSAKPSVDQHLTDPALIGAIDLHAHSDPDSSLPSCCRLKHPEPK